MSQEKTRSRSHDLLGAILGLFCAVMLTVSPWQIDLDMNYPFYKGPFLMPIIALTLGIAASLPSWYRLLFKGKGRSWTLDGAGAPKKPCLMLLAAIFYAFSIMAIGLELGTLIALAMLLVITGSRNAKVLIGVPLVVTFIFWGVFRQLLDIYFPEPLIYYLFQ